MRRSRRSSTAPEPASGSRSSRRSRSSASERTALALLAGGALGNLVDRVRDGAVTDFIRWRVHDHRWPIFNVADAALLVGVLLLTLSPQSKARGESKAGAMLAG